MDIMVPLLLMVLLFLLAYWGLSWLHSPPSFARKFYHDSVKVIYENLCISYRGVLWDRENFKKYLVFEANHQMTYDANLIQIIGPALDLFYKDSPTASNYKEFIIGKIGDEQVRYYN